MLTAEERVAPRVVDPILAGTHQGRMAIWASVEVSHVVSSHVHTSSHRENYCIVKSNICWGVGVPGMEEGLFWASVEQMPRMPGGDQLPLQIRALNYKVFTTRTVGGSRLLSFA